jgi:hypothetical protein
MPRLSPQGSSLHFYHNFWIVAERDEANVRGFMLKKTAIPNRLLFWGQALLLLALASSGPSLEAQQQEALANQLVVIRTGNDIRILRAASVENKGDLTTVVEENGTRKPWQSSLIIKTLPLFVPAQSSTYTQEQAAEALAELEKLQTTFPQAKILADAEIGFWKAWISERRQAEKERLDKLIADLQGFLAIPYDAGFDYSKEALSAKIEQGEALMLASPDKTADLEIFLSPWRQHLSHLEEGRIRVDGVWTTREEIAQKEEAVRLAEEERIFAEIAGLEMPLLVVPQTSILLVLGFVIFALISILYLFLHLASSRGGNLSFGGALLLLAGLSMLGFYIYAGYLLFAAPSTLSEIPNLMPAKDNPESQKTIQRILYLSARPSNPKMSPDDLRPSVQDQTINAYLKAHLKFTSSQPDQFFDMRRTAMAVRFEPHQVTVFEETLCLGKSMLIRYQISCSQTAERIQFSTVEVKLGNAPLPGSMSSYLWKRLQTALDAPLNGKNIHQTYQLNEIGTGTFGLVYSPRLTDREMAKPRPDQPVQEESPTPAAEDPAAPAPETSSSATTEAAPDLTPQSQEQAQPEPAAEAPMN